MASEKGNDEKIITIKDLNDLEDIPNIYLEAWSESVYHKIILSPIEYMSEKELAPCFEFLIKKIFFDFFKTEFKDEGVKNLKSILTRENLDSYFEFDGVSEAFAYFLTNKLSDYISNLFDEKNC